MHGVERVLLAYMPIEAEGDAYPNRGAARPRRKECFPGKTLTPPSRSIVGHIHPTMPLTTARCRGSQSARDSRTSASGAAAFPSLSTKSTTY